MLQQNIAICNVAILRWNVAGILLRCKRYFFIRNSLLKGGGNITSRIRGKKTRLLLDTWRYAWRYIALIFLRLCMYKFSNNNNVATEIVCFTRTYPYALCAQEFIFIIAARDPRRRPRHFSRFKSAEYRNDPTRCDEYFSLCNRLIF